MRRAAWAEGVLGALVVAAVATVLVMGQAPLAPVPTPTPVTPPASSTSTTPNPTPADGVLRVYSNNIENLVRNDAGGACTQVTELEHLDSMVVDDAGRTGTDTAEAPDLLLLQQVSGSRQADDYAAQLSTRFGLPAGTYRSIVAWADPEGWGSTHDCRVRALGEGKAQQTNAIIYNSASLTLTDTGTFAAGWLKPGTAYANGRGCTTYAPPSVDANTKRTHKWKRTTAVAARFRIAGTTTTVFAASLHLPQQNRRHACAGPRDAGVDGSGIRLDPAAKKLLDRSQVRVIGVDANRTGLGAAALDEYGLTGYGTGTTIGHGKIDYLFVRGDVEPSAISHTVAGTRSNHLALYGFIAY